MKHVHKNFYRYISMSILGMLGSAGTILADTFFVSDKLGARGLAALNIAICIFGLINGLGLLFGIGGSTYYSISKARGEHTKGNEIFSLSLYSSLGFGGILLLGGLFFSEPIVRFLGAEGSILPMADMYMKTILCFSPFFILRHVYICFIRNDGGPRLAMVSMLVGSIANIVLDYVFMYPLGMGIFGAALATALTPVIGIVICSPYLLQKKNKFHCTKVSGKLREFWKICSFGTAAFINEFSSGIVLLVFNLLILTHAGNIGIAAYGIIANLALVVMAVFTGISQGIQPLLSKAHGEGNEWEVQTIYRHGLRLSAILGLLILLGTYRFAPALVSMFNHEHNLTLQAIAENGLQIYFVSFLFLGYNFMATSRFSATEKPRFAFTLSFFRGFAGIIALAAAFAALWGIDGVWLSIPTVEFLTLLMGICFSKKAAPVEAPHYPIEQMCK